VFPLHIIFWVGQKPIFWSFLSMESSPENNDEKKRSCSCATSQQVESNKLYATIQVGT
jgi:hypothetical protein